MRQHTFLALATKAHYVENTSVIRQDSTSTSSVALAPQWLRLLYLFMNIASCRRLLAASISIIGAYSTHFLS